MSTDFLHSVRTLQQYTYRRGIHYKLDAIKMVLARLGDPQNGLRYIHIAGTNGKGSTVAFLSSALQAAGFKVGTYTSPHLISYTERIAISQKPISEPDFCRLFQVVERQLTKKETLTEFEILTAMAFLYFQEQKPDFVILETGLGGRLDATNVITPLISVITRIDYDHQAILGNTLAEIATEKAGIIKPNVPVVTISQLPEVMALLKLSARKKLSLLTVVKPLRHYPKNYAMQGVYQKENLALARAVLSILKQHGALVGITQRDLNQGLQRARMPFRYQIFRKQKRVLVVDAAHNPLGISVLISSLKQDFGSVAKRPICPHAALKPSAKASLPNLVTPVLPPVLPCLRPNFFISQQTHFFNQKPVVLISILKTKNASEMLGRIFDYTDTVYYCEWSDACFSYQELRQHFQNLKAMALLNVDAFLQQNRTPLLVITGSIYFLGAINAGQRLH